MKLRWSEDYGALGAGTRYAGKYLSVVASAVGWTWRVAKLNLGPVVAEGTAASKEEAMEAAEKAAGVR